MFVIELTEDKYEKLAKHVEEMLHHGGQLMKCLDELKEESDTQRSLNGKRIQMLPYANNSERDYESHEDPDTYYGRHSDYRMGYRPDYDRHPDREQSIGYRRY